MYGMVNKFFIKSLMTEYGDETWSEIEKKSGLETNFFVGMEQYPDDVTYTIVGAASDVTGVSVEDTLEMFGENWVEMTAKAEYGHYYAMADDLFDFLENLNSMHESLGAGLANLRQPSFSLSRLNDGSAQLTYKSERAGLTSFVVGLLNGLAGHYGQEIKIKVVGEKQRGADNDQFLISIV